jgi:TolB-like protein/Flp pilus assembly protein TadD
VARRPHPNCRRPHRRAVNATAPSLLLDAWRELRRRKVVRAAGTYAVGAFVVLQVAEITFAPLGLPPRALTWTILAAILGFPLVLVLAWFFDVGPDGLTRDRSRAARAGALSALVLVLLTVLGVGWWLAGVYAEPPADQAGAAAPTSAPENSVAVLPFADMSPKGDQSHLGDGIAEELLDRLARNRDLRVAARTSSFALRGHSADIKEIGRLLNVRWVLEGSVRKAGGRLRITAQLIDAGSGYHQWSETYEREDGDLFALQDEVSLAIAGQLQGLIRGSVAADRSGTPAAAVDPQALEHFLHGRQQWRLRTPAGLQQAEALFLQAVEADPRFARAWAGLADTYLLQADYDLRPLGEALGLAEPAAVRAVTLAPELGEAWASLGLLRMMAGQLSAAERSLREAMRLDPRYEMAPMWLASVLGRSGDLVEQEVVLRQAQQLNPLEPVINTNLAQLLALRGDADGAEALIQRLLAITPDDALLLRTLAELRGRRGHLAEALRHARAALATDPRAPANVEMTVGVLLQLGAVEDAQQLVDGLPAPPETLLPLRQWIALYRPQPAWLPEVRERLARMSPAALAGQQRLVFLGAWAAIATGAGIEALPLLQRLSPNEPADTLDDIEASGLLAALQQRPPDPSWARRAARWEEQVGRSALGAYSAATLYALADRRDDALRLLEQAERLGWCDLPRTRTDPRLRALHDAPRFAELLGRMQARISHERQRAGLAD